MVAGNKLVDFVILRQQDAARKMPSWLDDVLLLIVDNGCIVLPL